MKAKFIPNILSVLRLLMAFAFAAIFIWGYPEHILLAALIFIVAGLTDVVDGILARRFGWITQAGKILDPLADKIMQFTALLCLTLRQILPAWILVFIVVKELLTGCGAIVLFKKCHEIGVAKYFGKAYTVMFYAVIMLFLLFGDMLSEKIWLTYTLCAAMAAVAAVVLVMYYMSYLKNKMRRKKTN